MIVGGPTDRSQSGPAAEFSLFTRDGLERIGAKFGGRPHWGKMNWATAADLRPLYPRFDDFLRVRQELDPTGMFLNAYLRRVLGL
jgi:FAD/FMN-containing dehydrogenase